MSELDWVLICMVFGYLMGWMHTGMAYGDTPFWERVRSAHRLDFLKRKP